MVARHGRAAERTSEWVDGRWRSDFSRERQTAARRETIGHSVHGTHLRIDYRLRRRTMSAWRGAVWGRITGPVRHAGVCSRRSRLATKQNVVGSSPALTHPDTVPMLTDPPARQCSQLPPKSHGPSFPHCSGQPVGSMRPICSCACFRSEV
jgi:hypothetical protein